MNPNYQPPRRTVSERLYDFLIDLIEWIGKHYGWVLMAFVIIYLITKTYYDLNHNYEPTMTILP